jgi:hypothetical protein
MSHREDSALTPRMSSCINVNEQATYMAALGWHIAWNLSDQDVSGETEEIEMMSPVSAAVAGALISGVVMYTVGERSDNVSAFSQQPVEYVQTVDGRVVAVAPAAQPAAYGNSLRPASVAAPAVVTQPVQRVAPRQTVYRTTAPVQERIVEREPAPAGRSWKKTAMIIGGSSAAGAGVGGIIDGKKGALIGAAIGGGAASIYEATKR